MNLPSLRVLYGRGYELRKRYKAKRQWNGLVATDELGCGILDFIGRTPGDHLDLGTGAGAGSAWVVAQSKTEGRVYTCEIEERKQGPIRAALKGLGVEDRITFVVRPSNPLPFPGPFVTAYIDAGHEYEDVIRDWKNVHPITEKFVLFDDVLDESYPGVAQAFDEAALTPGWREVVVLGRVGILERA